VTTEPIQPAQPGQSVDPATQPFTPAAPEPGPFEVPPQPVAVATPKRRGGSPGWLNVLLGLAVAVAIGGVAFAAGRMTAPATASVNAGNGGNGGRFFQGGNVPEGFPGGGNGGDDANRQGFPGARGAFGGASIQGTVTAVTPDSITIHTASGQDVTIALDSTTTYHQESSATASDVKTGGTVIVRIGFGGGGTSETPTGPTANDVTVVP
jgi:hypothetical protein